MICFENNDMNLNVEYSNSIFLGDDKMDSFTDDFESIKSVEFYIFLNFTAISINYAFLTTFSSESMNIITNSF